MSRTPDQLLTRPLPYEVVWQADDGRVVSVRHHSREVAERFFRQLLDQGLEPALYIGQLHLAGSEAAVLT